MRQVALLAMLSPMAAVFTAAGAAELVLVDKGVVRMPIMVAQDSLPETIRAADDLAQYIEKISGARPQVIKGAPGQVPQRAIWVGFQPELARLLAEG